MVRLCYITECFNYNLLASSLIDKISLISAFIPSMFKFRLILLFFFAALAAKAQLTYNNNLRVDYDSAWTYKNLKVIPIRYKGPRVGLPLLSKTISLSNALAKGLVTVQERGTTAVENVHWLSLVNNSDKDVYVASGEIMAGGRQDRMVTKDTLVMARSGRIDLPVMCVEEGRWSEKDKKFTYKKMANMRLRKVLDLSRSQVHIWREINAQLDSSKIKSKNLAYLAREKDKKFVQLQNEYWNFFKQKFQQPDSNIVGVVCMSGNRIIGSDIFVSSDLFYGQLASMMLGYIEDATIYGSNPVTVTNTKVQAYLDQFLKSEEQQEEFVKKNGKLFKAGGKAIHLTTY
jgi:hypothetical protein